MWVFIVNQVPIELQKKLNKLKHHMAQTLFCFCLQHPGLLSLAIYFDTLVENLMFLQYSWGVWLGTGSSPL